MPRAGAAPCGVGLCRRFAILPAPLEPLAYSARLGAATHPACNPAGFPIVPSVRSSPIRLALLLASSLALAGCGSTRTSNTMRTATEQMLISDAIDRTVDTIDFKPLAGQSVYFDDEQLDDVVDKGYLVSSLRQHMLASGCVLKTDRDEATYIVEPRAGAVGTDNHDLLFGVPAIQLPQVPVASTMPAAIPEIPFAKRRDQRGVAKVAVFAYRRDTGEPVWQSGIVINKSTANDIWVLGAGPFQRGTIYDRAQFAGKDLGEEEDQTPGALGPAEQDVASLNESAVFGGLRAGAPPLAPRRDPAVQQASATRERPRRRASDAPFDPESPPPRLAEPAASGLPMARPLSEAPAG